MHDELTDDTVRACAADLIRTLGPNAAARALSVSREAALSLAAGAPVTRGTLALARAALARADEPPEAA